MTPQGLPTPYPRKSEKFFLGQLPAAFVPFAASRYTRMTLLLYIAFFSNFASAQNIQNLSVPISIQFSNAGIAPASPGFADKLSREVGVTLSYLEPRSEDSHVFLVSGLFADFPLSDLLQRLRRRADVLSVSEDIADGGSALAHVVVKFSKSVVDPSQPAFVWALSRDVGVTFVHLFEKAHGVQAFRVNGLSRPTQLSFILQRLKSRSDVLAATTNQ